MNKRLLMKKRDETKLISELNVVPYIDVMLVLLIIFMVTAPLLQHSIEVNLPETAKSEQKVDVTSDPIVVTVSKVGDYFLNTSDEKLTLRSLSIKVLALKKMKKDQKIKVYIRGDKDSSYNDIVRVISTLKKHGLNNIGLMSNSI